MAEVILLDTGPLVALLDKEGFAVEWVFTRRVAAKKVLDHDEARFHPCHPWFLNCRF